MCYLIFTCHPTEPKKGHPGEHRKKWRHAALRGRLERQQGGGEPSAGGKSGERRNGDAMKKCWIEI